MTYKVASGYDNEAGLATLGSQPKCSGVRSSRYLQAASGTVIPDGYSYAVWEWENLLPSVYEALLNDLGLSIDYDDIQSEITISTIESDRSTFTNFNALCIHRKDLDTEYSFGVYRRVSVTMKKLRIPS